MVSAGSAETGARRLLGNPSGWRRHGGFGRCASSTIERARTEVLRGNRSRWGGGGAAELFCCVGKGRNEVGSRRVW